VSQSQHWWWWVTADDCDGGSKNAGFASHDLAGSLDMMSWDEDRCLVPPRSSILSSSPRIV